MTFRSPLNRKNYILDLPESTAPGSTPTTASSIPSITAAVTTASSYTTTPSSNPSPATLKSKEHSVGNVVGIVVGATGGAFGLIAVGLFIVKRRRRSQVAVLDAGFDEEEGAVGTSSEEPEDNTNIAPFTSRTTEATSESNSYMNLKV